MMTWAAWIFLGGSSQVTIGQTLNASLESMDELTAQIESGERLTASVNTTDEVTATPTLDELTAVTE